MKLDESNGIGLGESIAIRNPIKFSYFYIKFVSIKWESLEEITYMDSSFSH